MSFLLDRKTCLTDWGQEEEDGVKGVKVVTILMKCQQSAEDECYELP